MKPSRGQSIVVSLLAVFFLSLSNCLAADKKPSGLDDYLKKLGYLPISLKRNHDNQLVADVLVGGKKHYFIVDTGCSFTILDPEIKLGVKPVDGQTAQFDDQYIKDVDSTNLVCIEDLRLGGLQFQNQPAVRYTLKMEFHGTIEKGILGCDFLDRYHCIVDCTHERLYVFPAEPQEQIRKVLAESLRRSKFAEVDFKLSTGLVPTCVAKANDRATRVIIDTGGIWTTFDADWARTNNIRVLTNELSMVSLGKNGAHTSRMGALDSLQIGETSFTNVFVALVPLRAPYSENHLISKALNGFLGAETLAEIGALIDFDGRKMWFNPSSHAR